MPLKRRNPADYSNDGRPFWPERCGDRLTLLIRDFANLDSNSTVAAILHVDRLDLHIC
ncbi:hypothetical protein SUS17_968 [Sphingomonas sp. S17]|nr:hypothetical protein SUS17_968 [Sphingomonas sp. S17]